MKHVKKAVLLLSLAVFLMTGVCACGMDKELSPSIPSDVTATEQTNKEQANKELTERQKAVLAQQGLPQNYEELSSRQKMSIDDIEEMLQAVETKYGIKFSYVDYTAEYELESGVLSACPEGGRPKLDTFTVQRGQDGGFTDTYMCVAARDPFTAYLEEYLAGVTDSGNFRVYGKVLSTSLSAPPVARKDLPGNVRADSWIFVDGAKVTEAEFNSLTENVTQWLQGENLPGSAYFVLLKEGTLILLTEYNFTDYLSGEYMLAREFCNIPE